MMEQASEGKLQVNFVADVRESLRCATTNQERIDVLTRARKYADSQWFYWIDVRKYIDNQSAIVELEAQLKLPLVDSL